MKSRWAAQNSVAGRVLLAFSTVTERQTVAKKQQ